MPVIGKDREWNCIDKMVRHHCIIMRGGKVISTGHNKPIPFTWNGSQYMRHAECDAILGLPRKYLIKRTKRPISLTLYVYRTGKGTDSKPCEQCIRFMKLISQYTNCEIKTIIYSTAQQITVTKEHLNNMDNTHQTTYWKAMRAREVTP